MHKIGSKSLSIDTGNISRSKTKYNGSLISVLKNHQKNNPWYNENVTKRKLEANSKEAFARRRVENISPIPPTVHQTASSMLHISRSIHYESAV